jgi:hypothetical protein
MRSTSGWDINNTRTRRVFTRNCTLFLPVLPLNILLICPGTKPLSSKSAVYRRTLVPRSHSSQQLPGITVCFPRLRHSINTKFQESRVPWLSTTIPLGHWPNWKPIFVPQFPLVAPVQWGYRLSRRQWGLASRLSLSPHETRFPVPSYGNRHPQHSARLCESSSPTFDTSQGSNSRI